MDMSKQNVKFFSLHYGATQQKACHYSVSIYLQTSLHINIRYSTAEKAKEWDSQFSFPGHER